MGADSDCDADEGVVDDDDDDDNDDDGSGETFSLLLGIGSGSPKFGARYRGCCPRACAMSSLQQSLVSPQHQRTDVAVPSQGCMGIHPVFYVAY